MTHKIQNLHESVRVYRDTKKPKENRSELGEQINSYQWFKYQYPHLEQALFYVPNETQGQKGKNGKLTGPAMAHQKRMNEAGRSDGVSDLILLHQTVKHPYAVIEMKSTDKKSMPSKSEKAFLNHHAEQGAFVCVCYGAEQFKLAVREYLS